MLEHNTIIMLNHLFFMIFNYSGIINNDLLLLKFRTWSQSLKKVDVQLQ